MQFFFPPKTVKIETKNRFVCNYNVCYVAKFKLHRIKNTKVVPQLHFQSVCWPGVISMHKLKLRFALKPKISIKPKIKLKKCSKPCQYMIAMEPTNTLKLLDNV